MGVGASGDVYTDSVGVTELAPRSVGISGMGAGPVTIAEAGEAVAMSHADTAANEGAYILN